MKLYDYDASANCYKAAAPARAPRDAVRARAGRHLRRATRSTDEYRAVNPLARDAGSGARLRREDRPVERDPLVPGRGNAATCPTRGSTAALVAQWLHFEQERVMGGIGSARFRIMTGRDPALAAARFPLGEAALEVLDEHLAERSFLVGERCSIADVSDFAYTHVAPDAGYDLDRVPGGRRLARAASVEQPRLRSDDLAPYPENARRRREPLDLRLDASSAAELALPLPSARRARSRAWRASSGRSRHRARPGSGGARARARRPRADGRQSAWTEKERSMISTGWPSPPATFVWRPSTST